MGRRVVRSSWFHVYGGWLGLLLTASVAAAQGCGNCYVEEVPFPNGTFAVPVISDSMQTTGEPFFTPFPRGFEVEAPVPPSGGSSGVGNPSLGVGGTAGTSGWGGAGGEAWQLTQRVIPSARLTVDSEHGVLTRYYVTESGQSVIERYRFTPDDPKATP